jgi:hypothetical protein
MNADDARTTVALDVGDMRVRGAKGLFSMQSWGTHLCKAECDAEKTELLGLRCLLIFFLFKDGCVCTPKGCTDTTPACTVVCKSWIAQHFCTAAVKLPSTVQRSSRVSVLTAG